MKRAIQIAACTFFLATVVCSQTRTPIFRSINVSTVNKKRTIELGGELKSNTDILIKSGDAFVLNGNSGNTERIAVYLNGDGKVREIVFEYGNSRAFEKFTNSYIEDLGEPQFKGSISSRILNARMVAWEDSKTRFEIVEIKQNGKIQISSAMTDKSTQHPR